MNSEIKDKLKELNALVDEKWTDHGNVVYFVKANGLFVNVRGSNVSSLEVLVRIHDMSTAISNIHDRINQLMWAVEKAEREAPDPCISDS